MIALLSSLARADAGPEEDEEEAPVEAPEPRPSALASVLPLQGPLATVLSSPLPLCPDPRQPCGVLARVAPDESTPWDGLLERNISGVPGTFVPRRRR